MTERLTEKTDEGIWVKESHGENVMKTLYHCYGAEPLPNYSNCDEGYCGMEKLAEYETAEEERRMVVMPCKIGDTLFVITPDSPTGIETTKCMRLSIDKRGIKIQAPAICDDWGNAKWNFKPIDFGKKVFLDFEEAKKALREREGIHE